MLSNHSSRKESWSHERQLNTFSGKLLLLSNCESFIRIDLDFNTVFSLYMYPNRFVQIHDHWKRKKRNERHSKASNWSYPSLYWRYIYWVLQLIVLFNNWLSVRLHLMRCLCGYWIHFMIFTVLCSMWYLWLWIDFFYILILIHLLSWLYW